MKYFRLKYDEILWQISYANYVMLQATIPVYDPDDDDEGKGEQKGKKDSDHDGIEDLANYLKL